MKKSIYLNVAANTIDNIQNLLDKWKQIDPSIKSFILQELSVRKGHILFSDDDKHASEVKYGKLYVIESLINFFAIDCEKTLVDIIKAKGAAQNQPISDERIQKEFNEKVLNSRGVNS